MQTVRRCVLLVGLAGLILGGMSSRLLVAEEPAIKAIHVGFEGATRRGHWAEIGVDLQTSQALTNVRWEAVTRDGDGAPVAYASPTLDLAAGATTTRWMFKVGPPRSTITVRLIDGERTLLEKRLTTAEQGNAYSSTSQLVAVIGQEDVGLTGWAKFAWQQRGEEAHLLTLPTAASLPNDFRAYDAITQLVLIVGRRDPLADATPIQRESLLRWINSGGRLTIAFANGGEQQWTTADAWSDWNLPTPESPRPLASENGLKSFSGEPLPFEFESIADKPLLLPFLTPREQVLQWESGAAREDRPLAIQVVVGFGRVNMLAVDLSHPQLSNWSGRQRVWTRLFARGAEVKSWERPTTSGGQASHRGYVDLSGQLRAALDQYPQVAPIHFYGVAAGLLLYLLVLGPGEYFLLRRFFPTTMQLTWLLLPLIVGGMVGLAIWLGQSTRGAEVRVNQVSLLDINAHTGQERGWWWAGIFAPTSQAWSLEMRSTREPFDAALGGAQALVGHGLGGIDTPPLAAGTPSPYTTTTSTGDPIEFQRLSFPAASSKLLQGTWWRQGPSTRDASQLRSGKLGVLEGTFRNVAPVPLANAFLAYGEYMYRANDDIAPGATVKMASLTRKHLESVLTRRQGIAASDLTTPWNADDRDIHRILETRMFHQAVGGANYTVLTENYEPQLDLSELLNLGYAVLVGRSERPLVALHEQEQPFAPQGTRRWNYYRIVYRVASPNESESAAKPVSSPSP